MSRRSKSHKRKKMTAKREIGPSIPKASRNIVSGPRSSRARMFLVIGVNILAIWGVILTTWVVFNPRVFVQPVAALDPNNPAFTPFVVHNQGYKSIYDVKLSCSIKYIEYPGDIHVVGLGHYTNRISNQKHVAKVIAPGEQCTVLLPLADMKHNKIENADIAIVLTFKSIKWLWQRETLHRFVSTQGTDRQWHWLPQPINK